MTHPKYTWKWFEAINDNPANAFETMTRSLFKAKFVDDTTILFNDINLPGIEVEPVPRKMHSDAQTEMISFQSKFFKQKFDIEQVSKSFDQIIKHWTGKLDCVYLFCNQAITKRSERYNEAVEKLSKSKIKLIPIVGDILLDLAMEFPEISDRYFIYDLNLINNYLFSTHNTVVNVNSITVNNNHPYTEDLYDIFDEHISRWKRLLFELDFKSLRDTVNSFLQKRNIPERYSGQANFYRLLLSIRANDSINNAKQLIVGHDLTEVIWLDDFYRSASNISYIEFIQHIDEVKVLILERLFGLHNWDCIINLYEQSAKRDDAFYNCFTLFYGLSLFNVGRFKESYDCLNRLYEDWNKYNVRFYALLAELKFLIEDSKSNEGDVHNLINELSDIKKKASICEEDTILSLVVIMEAMFNLDEFDELIKLYNEQSERIQTNEAVSYYYALCLETLGRYDEAASCYSHLNWVTSEVVTARYMMCLIHSNNYSLTTNIYNQCESKNSTIVGLYLYNLLKSGHPDYTHELNSAIEVSQNNLHDLINVLYFVSDENVIPSSIDVVAKLLNDETLDNWKQQEVDQLLMFLAKHHSVDLIERVLKSIPNVSIVSAPVAYGIVNSIFDYSKRYSLPQNINQEDRMSLQSIECVANLFIDANTLVQDYLRIAMFASRFNNNPSQSLQYSKRLFKDCKDIYASRNIVRLILELNLITEEFNLLSDATESLKQSEIPSDSMLLAFAMSRLGKNSEADYYTYKALCLLQNEIDYNILELCLQYYISNQNRITSANQIRSVQKSCVALCDRIVVSG